MAKRRKPKAKPKKSTLTLTARKQEELLGILLIVLGLFTLIALFTHNPEEDPNNYLAGTPITNGLGFAGIYLSYALIRWTIGYPIFILPFLLIFWGANRLFDKGIDKLLKFTLLSIVFAFFLSISFALHDAIANAAPDFFFSGILGGLGAQILIGLFGKYGAVVVLVGLIMAGVLLASTITFSQMYDAVSGFLMRGVEWLRHWLLDLKKSILKKTNKPKISHGFGNENNSDKTIINRGEKRPAFGGDSAESGPVPVARNKNLEQLKLELAEDKVSKTKATETEAEPEEDDVAHSHEYILPPLELLQSRPEEEPEIEMTDEELQFNANLLEEKLADFGLETKVSEIHPGPVITRYELQLAPGIKVSRITALADDLAMAMRAQRIRIVAPIPGKPAIGIEIPNREPALVYMQEILLSEEFRNSESPLTFAIGKTISGKPYIADLAKMPHLLVAGSTGSGKSVCLNTIIASVLFKAKPSEVQLVLIDPKRLELSTYAKLWRHHLNYVDGQKEKVATNPKSASAILKSLEQEMEDRYELLAGAGVRNIQEYNERIKAGTLKTFEEEEPRKPLSYLVLIVDELADLMLTASATKDVEEPIARLTQMSRAVGIHLVLATQRPSVDVITGVIKANFPARIAFQVASKVDSRTILDMNGAEKLLGRGDMLFLPPARPEPTRLHNAFITLEEIENVIGHVRRQAPHDKKALPAFMEEEETGMVGFERGKRDPLFQDAMNLVVYHNQGSVSLIQRRLKVGYSRAARLIDELEDAGVVGPFEGSKAREVLVTPEELEALKEDDDFEE